MYSLTGIQLNCFMAAEILSEFILQSELPDDVRDACKIAASKCWDNVPEFSEEDGTD